MSGRRCVGGLAPDPVLPGRDDVLDPGAVADRLAGALGRDGPLTVTSSTLVRAKYRVGESVRVVYRLATDAGPALVSARVFPDAEASAAAHARATAIAVATGRLRPVVHDPAGAAVWWTFPNDRRLVQAPAVMAPDTSVAALAAGGPGSWVRSEVAEYAPERSLTVRVRDGSGTTVGYAKVHRAGPVTAAARATRYRQVAVGLAARQELVASPRPVGWSDERDVVLLEAMPGVAWDQLDEGDAPSALARLGAALAHLHQLDPPPDSVPFTRLGLSRLRGSAAVVGKARPDVARRVDALVVGLTATEPAAADRVLLHGDCHPRNALVTGERLSLIDLDQAGMGPAAADLGSVLARLAYGQCVGERTGAVTGAMAASFLAGYGAVRCLPDRGSLRWHTTAALVAERLLRAVNRVHRLALDHLDALVATAERTRRRGVDE